MYHCRMVSRYTQSGYGKTRAIVKELRERDDTEFVFIDAKGIQG